MGSGSLEPRILLEDGPLLAVEKPAGLLTQGVPQGLPTLEGWVRDYLKNKYQKPGNVYLGIPHRLDRPVSGVIVFARNSKAAARLAEQFRERTVRKWYLAILEGRVAPTSGHLTDWLLKDAEAARTSVVSPETPGARFAELRYDVLQTTELLSLVRIELLTGRMHQIRVQFASRGWPVAGDGEYGAQRSLGSEEHREGVIALHAERLELKHPIRYDDLTLSAIPPGHWHELGDDATTLLSGYHGPA